MDAVNQTLEYLKNRYNANITQRGNPVEIANVTRNTLAEMFAELSFNIGVEVGVERGKYSKVLLDANPSLNLVSVDAWAAYEGYRDHMTQPEMDVLYQEASELLKPYRDRNILMKEFSIEAAKEFKDESLDFVYLDGNHGFVEVVDDIAAWERKVKVGGIVAGHDYIKRKNAGFMMQVPYAIDAYCAAFGIKPLFILGRKEKPDNLDGKKGELRESTRSWFYVKPPRIPMVPGWKAPIDNK